MQFVVNITKARGRKKGSQNVRHKYLMRFLLPTGQWLRIYPDTSELNDHGQVIGGPAATRKIIRREFEKKFFKDEPVITGHGRHTTKRIQIRPGFIDFDFRDSTVSRLYGRGVPKWMSKVQLPESEMVGSERTPEKEPPVEYPHEHDVPPMEDIKPAITYIPEPTTATQMAIGEKLEEDEDPILLARELLNITMASRSTGRTPSGEKIKPKRKRATVGSRKIKPLPHWAVAKYKDAAHLQRELSKEGKPLSTLITLGLWKKRVPNTKHKQQLISEWQSTIRYHSRQAVSMMRKTDTYLDKRKAEDAQDIDPGSAHSKAESFIRDEERKLRQIGTQVLLEEVRKYQATANPDNRFDTVANSSIMTAIYEIAQSRARSEERRVGKECRSRWSPYH